MTRILKEICTKEYIFFFFFDSNPHLVCGMVGCSSGISAGVLLTFMALYIPYSTVAVKSLLTKNKYKILNRSKSLKGAIRDWGLSIIIDFRSSAEAYTGGRGTVTDLRVKLDLHLTYNRSRDCVE